MEEMEGLARQLLSELRAELDAKSVAPLSTYRMQFNKAFRFEEARALVPYLRQLGVTDLYASPYLKAMPGSTHGYDCIDHHTINPEVGTPEEHAALCDALKKEGLGQLLDVVPNHMGIELGLNALWQDVLENGPSSIYARFFDVDWDPVKTELKDKVLLPILGDQYGIVLEKGELKLTFDQGAFTVRYWQHALPVAPRQYDAILGHRLETLQARLAPDDEGLVELLSILTAIRHLPHRTETDQAKRVERNREKEVIKRRLAALTARRPDVDGFIRENVEIFNGKPGDARSFDLLDKVLEGCSYRLAHWRVAGEEINYRRFFDINGLAAIRMEDPDVFEEAHGMVFRWLGEGKLTGLRIDHPDGLFDPTAYFLNLQERYVVERVKARFLSERGGTQDGWPRLEARVRAAFREEVTAHPESPLRKALYVVVEKIQGGRERIPEAWAVHGTVGYRFANAVTGLLVNRDAERLLTEGYHRFIGHRHDFHALLYEKKKLILKVSMSSELNVLARELNRISELSRRTRDFTLNSLRRALTEFIALFPVYRTYLDSWREVDDRDVKYIEQTIAGAKAHDPSLNASIFDFLGDVLLRRYPEQTTEEERALMLRFAMKLQQITGPVMAKGLEDTTFYIYNRLTSLNEVGGEPERFGVSPELFHLRNQERAELWPSAMLTTSTHDTKRSEDVRARINVLSELPEEWRAKLRKWNRLNQRFKTQVSEDYLWPIANDEYLFYQTLLGAWPMGEHHPEEELRAFRDRVRDYMLKAVKEAKVITSWVNPEPRYDEALTRFVEGVVDPSGNRDFFDDIRDFKRRIERPGQLNALSQVLLKLASPGVADIYQGCEMWDLSLVDPDNRRPVDYRLRVRALEALDADAAKDRLALCQALWRDMDDGRAKLYTVAQALRLRRRHEALFRRGGYRPLDVTGPRAAHAVVFARELEGNAVIAVAPRLTLGLLDGDGLGKAFGGTRLLLTEAEGSAPWVDIFTGRRFIPSRDTGAPALDLGELLAHFPLALLEQERG
ncbi:MAG TPA: malto-oligosyltrehalose synthase [Myxococcaceae bacterium]|nr:malto-oligosyltrehalose synthase [Myxococcaceae bacterium]